MKKTQIIIIATALFLTLACVGTFAVLYFATDTFKSEQEMFYKYASQINFKDFIDLESYNTYLERLKTTGHANEGEFSIEIAQNEEIISEAIKYNGYSDPVNKSENYDININKDNETLLEMNYLNKQDFYGILFKDVVSQYAVFENNNLKELASKMGVEDTSEIPNKIEIPETIKSINHEQINTILNTYLNIAIETIPEDNYSKIEKQEIALGDETIKAEGYQVKLKVKDVQNIFIKVLENAKNDEQIYNLLNSEDIAFEDYQDIIDELLVGLSEEIPNEENFNVITINVYKQGKETVKFSALLTMDEEVNVEISIENTAKGMMIRFINTTINYDETEEKNIITITKTASTDQQESFECVVSEIIDGNETQLLSVNVARNGTFTSNNVTHHLSVMLNVQMPFSVSQENLSLKIGIKNSTNFLGVPKQGDFVQGNHLVINGLAPEQITNLFTNLGSMVLEKLKDEMFVSMIINIMTVNEGLFESAQQATQQYQNAFEQEQQLSNAMIEMNGVQYSADEILSQY